MLGSPVVVALFLCGACAGPAAVEVAPAAPAATPPGPGAHLQPKTRLAELAAAPVYDAAGQPSACAAPLTTCAPTTPTDAERGFLDRCRHGGFQVRQCGCEQRCSGDVAAQNRRYDAAGTPKECAPARTDCAPPPAGAAFQDACSERGFRLDVCGCEWLCSGNPRK